MKNRSNKDRATLSPLNLRAIAVGLGTGMLTLGILAAYGLWIDIIPLISRIYTSASIIETPYAGFFLIPAITITPIAVIGCAVAAWQGCRFDPEPSSWLYQFQLFSAVLTVRSLIYISPALAILCTSTLLLKDYRPCPKSLTSDYSLNLVWVRDERVCFQLDVNINENRPWENLKHRDNCAPRECPIALAHYPADSEALG